MTNIENPIDQKTADAFSFSWNNLPIKPVYTRRQFEDWMEPLKEEDVAGRDVLELGCGNGSLMFHLAAWKPRFLAGVDLGNSVSSARKVMSGSGNSDWKIERADLVSYKSPGFDIVYCIGVIHHLKAPKDGFDSVIRNLRPGGHFHCWVYAREGNDVVVYFVDPIRRFASKLPWWVTKYLFAAALAFPYYIYAKSIRRFKNASWTKHLPMYQYSLWIAERGFAFFRHVAFDQLVTPQTTYIKRETVEEWLASDPRIDKSSIYIIMRNGNSWKFGGRVK